MYALKVAAAVVPGRLLIAEAAAAGAGAPRSLRSLPLLLLAVLAGCVAPPVSDLGAGRYHLAVRAAHGAEGLDLDRANALHLADQFCRKSGQRARPEGFDNEGPFKASAAVGLVFSCEQPAPEEMPHHNPG